MSLHDTLTTPERPSPPIAPTRLPTDQDPWHIVNDPRLEPETKLELLRQLEYHVRQVQVALEEGMRGTALLPSFAQIRAAMAQLGPHATPETNPTKV